MDQEDDDQVASLLGGTAAYNAGPPRAPIPCRGLNIEFDRYCDRVLDNVDPREDDTGEMRRALWATWKTKPPSGFGGPSGLSQKQEDDALASALALSVTDRHSHSSRQTSLHPPGDDDEELRLAIALSQEEAREPKRRKREETPEDERRMLAEAMAASLAAQQEAMFVHDVSDDEELSSAQVGYGASRNAKPRNSHRGEWKADSSSAATRTPSLPTILATPSVCAAEFHKSKPDVEPGSGHLTGFSVDRVQLEQERLARQAARQSQAQMTKVDEKHSTPPILPVKPNTRPAENGRSSGLTSHLSRSTQEASVAPGPPVNGSKRSSNGVTHIAGPSREGDDGSRGSTRRGVPDRTTNHPLQSAEPFPVDEAGECYVDGEMRHTELTIGEPTTARTFSPSQVIGKKSQISLIILSSFVIDDDWLATIMPPPQAVPTIVIRPHPKEMHPAWNGKVQAQMNDEVRCYPEMVGEWGSAHMKFAWIFYKTGRLRVAIMTANMVPYDWDWIENTIFIQDFLLRSSGSIARPTSLFQDFSQRFRFLFVHLKVHKALRHLISNHQNGKDIPFHPGEGFEDMAKYDWSRVRVRIVMSVPGNYSGLNQVDDFGLCRLGKVLSDEGWRPRSSEVVQAEFQGSSLGTYSLDWFDTFYQCCCGRSAQTLIGRPKPTSWPPLKVLFPSLATVDSSILGRDGGGTMFCGRSMNSTTRPLFHDANSKRGGVLMHAKVLIALFEPRGQALGMEPTSPPKNGKRKASELEGEDIGGWVYVGSHNFSSAAWGTANLKKKLPTLNVRNYELGIVFPLPRQGARAAADAAAPYKRPPRPYVMTDVPWDQKLHGNAT